MDADILFLHAPQKKRFILLIHTHLTFGSISKSGPVVSPQVPEEEDLYDEVDEDAYTEIVAARRKREDFVVDDDGLGYDDDGEDHLFDGPDAATLNKRGVHGNLDAKGLKKAKKLKGQMQASSSSGLEGGGSSVTDAGILGYMKTAAEKKTVARGPKPVTIGGLSAPAKPSLDLDSMLNDLSAAATVPAASKGGKSANPFVKTPTSMRPKAAAWTPAPALSGPADYDADEYQAGGDDDYTFDNDDDDYQAGNGDDEEDGSAMKEGDGEDASAAPAAAAPAPRSRFATNAGAAALKAAAEASALKKEQSEAATAAATATAAAASAPSVKAASLDADMDLDSGLAASSNNPALASQNAIDTAQWLGKDAESGDTYLDLYWMDAWEQNGAVYLFGKVAVQPPAGSPENTPASHVSCCVVVKNLQRCMFVLPRALPGHEVDDQTGKLKRFAWPDVHKEVRALSYSRRDLHSTHSFNLLCVREL
jgi:DNA polymerase alpha subunit A